jgi:hypothetical protein
MGCSVDEPTRRKESWRSANVRGVVVADAPVDLEPICARLACTRAMSARSTTILTSSSSRLGDRPASPLEACQRMLARWATGRLRAAAKRPVARPPLNAAFGCLVG